MELKKKWKEREKTALDREAKSKLNSDSCKKIWALFFCPSSLWTIKGDDSKSRFAESRQTEAFFSRTVPLRFGLAVTRSPGHLISPSLHFTFL